MSTEAVLSYKMSSCCAEHLQVLKCMLMLSPRYDRCNVKYEQAVAVLDDHAENYPKNAATVFDCCLVQSKARNHCKLNEQDRCCLIRLSYGGKANLLPKDSAVTIWFVLDFLTPKRLFKES